MLFRSLTIVLGTVTLIGLSGYAKVVKSLTDDALAGVSACSKVEAEMLEMRGDMWRHVSSDDPKDSEHMGQEIARLKGEIASGMKEIQAAIYSDEEREINRKLDPALQRYYALWEKTEVISNAHKNEEAYKMFADATPIVTELRTAIRAETDFNRNLGTK